MKLWIDAQLSPAIAAWINRTFDDIEAESVRELGLRDATDPEIFEEAKKALKSVIKKVNKRFLQTGSSFFPYVLRWSPGYTNAEPFYSLALLKIAFVNVDINA